MKAKELENPKANSHVNADKLGIDLRPVKTAKRHAKAAVWKDLLARAKKDGIKLNRFGKNGPQIGPVRWVFLQLEAIRKELAELIDQDLTEANRPGADRNKLVGLIYIRVMCLNATHTIFFGETTEKPRLGMSG